MDQIIGQIRTQLDEVSEEHILLGKTLGEMSAEHAALGQKLGGIKSAVDKLAARAAQIQAECQRLKQAQDAASANRRP